MATAAEGVLKTPKKASFMGLLLPIAMIGLAIVLYFTLDTKVAAPSFDLSHFVILGVILFVAGLMSGLTGFAFSAIGALTLFLLPPIVAVPLLQGLSACNQMLSLGKLRKEMPKTLREWFPYGPGPAILGGLPGVWVGTWVLNSLPGRQITLILGILIVLYSVYSLFKPTGLKIHGFAGAPSGVVVGAIGGAIGGFTAFPGLTVVVWTGLRDMAKAATRAIVQPFILALQIAALITNGYQHPKNFGPSFWIMLALTIPVVLPGTLTGVWLYHRISELDFKRACFLLLGIAGIGLVVKAESAPLLHLLHLLANAI
jgi:uncharacterized membrane protein YfcA